MFGIHWRGLVRTILDFVNNIGKVHFLLHGLDSTSGWVSNSKDSEVIVWIVLSAIVFRSNLNVDIKRLSDTVSVNLVVLILFHSSTQINNVGFAV
jgi:hypothetical protein